MIRMNILQVYTQIELFCEGCRKSSRKEERGLQKKFWNTYQQPNYTIQSFVMSNVYK